MGWSDWIVTPWYYAPPATASNTIEILIYATGRDGRDALSASALGDAWQDWRDPAFAASYGAVVTARGSAQLLLDGANRTGASAGTTLLALDRLGYSWVADASKSVVVIARTHPALVTDPDYLPGMNGLHRGVDYDTIPGTADYVQYQGDATEPELLDWYFHVDVGSGAQVNPADLLPALAQLRVHEISLAEAAGYFAPGGTTTVPAWPTRKPAGTALFQASLGPFGHTDSIGTLPARLTGVESFALLFTLDPPPSLPWTALAPDTSSGVDWGFNLSAATSNISNGPGQYDGPPHAVLQRLQNPPYRYWIPEATGPAVEAYLRMTQRNDGAGVNRHPRLAASAGASSVQSATRHGVAPRVGHANRYR